MQDVLLYSYATNLYLFCLQAKHILDLFSDLCASKYEPPLIFFSMSKLLLYPYHFCLIADTEVLTNLIRTVDTTKPEAE